MKLCKKTFGMFALIFMALLTLVSCGDVDFPKEGDYTYSSSSISGDLDSFSKAILLEMLDSQYEGCILRVEGKFISMFVDGEWEEATEFKVSGKKIVPVSDEEMEEGMDAYLTTSGSKVIMVMSMEGITVKLTFTK